MYPWKSVFITFVLGVALIIVPGSVTSTPRNSHQLKARSFLLRSFKGKAQAKTPKIKNILSTSRLAQAFDDEVRRSSLPPERSDGFENLLPWEKIRHDGGRMIENGGGGVESDKATFLTGLADAIITHLPKDEDGGAGSIGKGLIATEMGKVIGRLREKIDEEFAMGPIDTSDRKLAVFRLLAVLEGKGALAFDKTSQYGIMEQFVDLAYIGEIHEAEAEGKSLTPLTSADHKVEIGQALDDAASWWLKYINRGEAKTAFENWHKFRARFSTGEAT